MMAYNKAQTRSSARRRAERGTDHGKKNAWAAYAGDDGRWKPFAKAYCDFINNGKTERECVAYGEKLAKAHGFEDLNAVVRSGRKLNAARASMPTGWGKSFMLFVLGEKPLEEGMNILGAHIDSPRIDVKQNPLYEDTDLAYLDTHYYGGIKKYQWVTIPLALHGVIVRKTGEKVIINIGEDENDPVFCISDLLVHLAQEQMAKNAKEVVEGEALNLIVGGRPLEGEEKDAVKANVLKLLADKYGVEEEDFSAELEIVPAGKARDMGFDRSIFGLWPRRPRLRVSVDDGGARLRGHAGLHLCCIVTDKEEIGSVGATGMASHYLENTVAELYACTADYCDLAVRRCLRNSRMLSSDVSAGYDPNFASAFERRTARSSAAASASTSSPAAAASPAATTRTRNLWPASERSWMTRAWRSRRRNWAASISAAAERSPTCAPSTA